jgi:hypothetical protein
MSVERTAASVLADRFRLGTGLGEDERETILERMQPLGRRLASFSPETVELELSVKEREGADQRVTLECWMAGRDRLVSTSRRPAFDDALVEVRDDMIRRINDATTRREPRNNRRLRDR